MDTFEIGCLEYREPHHRYDFTKICVVEGTVDEAIQIANHLSPNVFGWMPAWRKCDGQDHGKE